MNYSQRKHIERLMADRPFDGFDPFGLRTPGRLLGMDVIESPNVPRYQMPEWLVPPRPGFDGVRWEPTLRQETNRWAAGFLGFTNPLPRGQFIVMANRLVARREDIVMLTNIC